MRCQLMQDDARACDTKDVLDNSHRNMVEILRMDISSAARKFTNVSVTSAMLFRCKYNWCNCAKENMVNWRLECDVCNVDAV
jgi:hypothetical protein